MNISFDNTENAFAYKNDRDLRRSRLLFTAMNWPFVVPAGARVAPFLMKTGLPVHGIIKKTLFRQFFGGETMEDALSASETLSRYGVQSLLSYVTENQSGEESFDAAAAQILKMIDFASAHSMPMVSVKVSALGRRTLMLKKSEAPRLRSGMEDQTSDINEWNRVRERMYRIGQAAEDRGISVLIDAEESWLQDPIDRLAIELMEFFNHDRPVVYNTLQLYRKDRLRFLKLSHAISRQHHFILGVKLVRGSYMDKEKNRALLRGYPSPIHSGRESTDEDYNQAVAYCMDHLGEIAVDIATHNERSTQLAIDIAESRNLDIQKSGFRFSQLYGMSDHITFNLAKAGFLVGKYLPYALLRDSIPYLLRRIQENSGFVIQTGRELKMIRLELQRREQLVREKKALSKRKKELKDEF